MKDIEIEENARVDIQCSLLNLEGSIMGLNLHLISLGLDPADVHSEKWNPTLKELAKIAAAYNLTIAELVTPPWDK